MLELEESKEIPPFSVVDEAVVPKKPSKPKVKLRTIFGLIFGLFTSTSIAFFREYWEKSEKKKDEEKAVDNKKIPAA